MAEEEIAEAESRESKSTVLLSCRRQSLGVITDRAQGNRTEPGATVWYSRMLSSALKKKKNPFIYYSKFLK